MSLLESVPFSLPATQVNCVLANVAYYVAARGLEPDVLLGGAWGLRVPVDRTARIFLETLLSDHFMNEWEVTDRYLDFAPAEVWATPTSFAAYLGGRRALGMCLPAENVYFRNDLNLEYWGASNIAHYVIVTEFDFAGGTCRVIDATPSPTRSVPIDFRASLADILAATPGGIWCHDVGTVIDELERAHPTPEARRERLRRSLREQSRYRLNASAGDGCGTAWLVANWERIATPGTEGWRDWLYPHVNIFQQWRVHRVYGAAALAQAFGRAPGVDEAIALQAELAQRTERLVYLCFKLEASPANRYQVLQEAGTKLLAEYRDLEERFCRRVLCLEFQGDKHA